MSSPEKKRKKRSLKPSSSPESNPNPSLPDDLVVSCLARVPRLYYPNLSLVSKSFRSILTSPELYNTRTLLGRTESFLYVCLRFPDETNPRWFILYRKPNQTLTNHTTKKTKKKKESSVNLLASISMLNSPSVEWSTLLAVGSNLYAISPAIENSPCSNVTFLDCRTHTWLEAPRMRLAHTNSAFDGRMYLPGSCENPDSLNCIEMYNSMTQTWNLVPPEKRSIFKLGNLEGKIYVNFDAVLGNVALKPKDGTWEAIGLDTNLKRGAICMIENISYLYVPPGKFLWRKFNTMGDVCGILQGLEGLPKFAHYSTVKLVNYGGKLMVLWDKYVAASGYKEKMIWCAEISLERRNNEEIWGKVAWIDAVLTVPKSYKFVCAIAATL